MKPVPNTTRTPKDKGTTTTIKVTRYDNGTWQVNGSHPLPDAVAALDTVTEFIFALSKK